MRVLRSAFLLCMPLPTLASERATSTDMLPWALQTAGLLVLVLGLFFALTFLLNRLRQHPLSTRQMKLLETLPLSRTEKICRVQVGDRIMLLGVTPGGITALAEQPAEETTTTDSGQVIPFARILSRCRTMEIKPS